MPAVPPEAVVALAEALALAEGSVVVLQVAVAASLVAEALEAAAVVSLEALGVAQAVQPVRLVVLTSSLLPRLRQTLLPTLQPPTANRPTRSTSAM